MMRRRNSLMCDLLVQRTKGKLLPIVLNNKTRYVLYRIAGWMAMEPTRESSWGRCTWQVRSMMASFGAWELESNGVSRNRR